MNVDKFPNAKQRKAIANAVGMWCPIVTEFGVYVKSRGRWKITQGRLSEVSHPVYISGCRNWPDNTFSGAVWFGVGSFSMCIDDPFRLDRLIRALLKEPER